MICINRRRDLARHDHHAAASARAFAAACRGQAWADKNWPFLGKRLAREIGRAARKKGADFTPKMQTLYRKLLKTILPDIADDLRL